MKNQLMFHAYFKYENIILPKKREIIPAPEPKTFKFVKKKDKPDLYFQRIGGKSGTIGEKWQNRSEQSNYFIKWNLVTPKNT